VTLPARTRVKVSRGGAAANLVVDATAEGAVVTNTHGTGFTLPLADAQANTAGLLSPVFAELLGSITSVGREVVEAGTKAEQRSALGLGTAATADATAFDPAGSANAVIPVAVAAAQVAAATVAGTVATEAVGELEDALADVATSGSAADLTVGTLPEDRLPATVETLPSAATPVSLATVYDVDPFELVLCEDAIATPAGTDRLVPVRAVGSGAYPAIQPGLRPFTDPTALPITLSRAGSSLQLTASAGGEFLTPYTVDVLIDGRPAKTWTFYTRDQNPMDGPNGRFALWLDPAQQVYSNTSLTAAVVGGTINEWFTCGEIFGRWRQATSARRPTLQEGANGRRYAQFPGEQKIVTTAADGYALPALQPPGDDKSYTDPLTEPTVVMALRIPSWTWPQGHGRLHCETVGSGDDVFGADAWNIIRNSSNPLGPDYLALYTGASASFFCDIPVPAGVWGVLVAYREAGVWHLEWWTGAGLQLSATSGTPGLSVSPSTITLGGRAAANDADALMDLAGYARLPFADAAWRTAAVNYYRTRLPT
jgi:hypothetical protein